jgi:curved DNA-binding protein CbpA
VAEDVDFYAVLGVGRGASQAQVARAFRRLAFRWHPDRNASQPELAHQRFLLVHQAYEVLSDPARRREFDSRRPRFVDVPPASPRQKPPEAARAVRKPQGAVVAPRPQPKRDAPLAPPSPKPSPARAFASRAAWIVLGGGIHVLGFLAMLIIGPIAERRTSDDLKRDLPWFVDFVFPAGRLAIAAGIVVLVIRAWNPDAIALAVPVGLLLAGAFVFVIERLVLASYWILGRRKSRRS